MKLVRRLKSGLKQASVFMAEQSFRPWPDLLVNAAYVPVFMMHRFATPDGSIKGHDPHVVGAALQFLRENDFVVMGLDELCDRAREHKVPPRAVVFTIDDGYWEQGAIGAELFLVRDLPVTLFLATAFTDGSFWPVESQVAFLFGKAKHVAPLTIGDEHLTVDPASFAETQRARRALVAELKRLPITEAMALLASVASTLNVEIPASPPTEFAPLSWSEARKLESRGVRFGAHTARHVTLSRENAQVSYDEVHASTERLRSELTNPSKVFCYPTGRHQDYGAREIRFLEQLGYSAAVNAEPGYFDTRLIRTTPFELLRFGFPDSLVDFKDIVLQVCRVRQQLGRRMHHWNA